MSSTLIQLAAVADLAVNRRATARPIVCAVAVAAGELAAVVLDSSMLQARSMEMIEYVSGWGDQLVAVAVDTRMERIDLACRRYRQQHTGTANKILSACRSQTLDLQGKRHIVPEHELDLVFVKGS